MEKFTRPLERATNNFDNKNVIGYGNRGLMYKAMFPNDLLLAVKRLHMFESFEKEFVLEIEILGRLRHTNLVPLLGFCHEREKKFLVYKYMCKGTLNQWLHSNSLVEGKRVGWTLSSKCILLDDKFEPKISNFGDSNILMNTSGIPSNICNFLVPNSSPYKEDVYSFGILLLELVTGREPSTWINSPTDHLGSRELIIIDESLMGQGFDEEIRETVKVAEKCIRAQTGGEISMRQVYQAMCAIGISSKEISVDLGMNIEDN
ncbi:probably inactive leucine-rich repeat receptor-like protein kinase [Tanacetum coccineum]